MKISLDGVSKRYQRHWVFRNITAEVASASSLAILGQNGSGKSTLLRMLAGMQPPTAGSIQHTLGAATIPQPELFRYLSFCAPGVELPEELSFEELLRFHFSFKKLLPGYTLSQVIAETGLQKRRSIPIADFSSGMRQRVKLAQALFSDTPLVFLDEPCTNLDEAGVAQYLEWIGRLTPGRTVIVASNDPREYSFTENRIRISDYQQAH
jgi:ABC-type multidrug transport system ATPase subunit